MKAKIFIPAAIVTAAFFIFGVIYKTSHPSQELIIITMIAYLISMACFGLFLNTKEELLKKYFSEGDKNALREIVFGKSKNQSIEGSK
jgi:hypothetical protein